MDLKTLLDIYDQELDNLDNPDTIIDLEVLSQEMVAEKTGNLMVMLISNSTRNMRRKLVRCFIEALDRESIKAHVEFKRALLRGFTTGAFSDANLVSDEHKKLLKGHWEIIKKTWQITDEERQIVNNLISNSRGIKQAS